jgi:hypothetical protein
VKEVQRGVGGIKDGVGDILGVFDGSGPLHERDLKTEALR